MKDAKLTRPVTATGNYSYLSSKMTGDRCLMLGDAFAFVDPIFSSGVLLAMKSAFFGADAVDACLRDPCARTTPFAALRKIRAHRAEGFHLAHFPHDHAGNARNADESAQHLWRRIRCYRHPGGRCARQPPGAPEDEAVQAALLHAHPGHTAAKPSRPFPPAQNDPARNY